MRSKLLFGLTGVLAAAFVVLFWPMLSESTPQVSAKPRLMQEITVIAQGQVFTPKEINIKALTPVYLTVWSLDYAYSVEMPGFIDSPKQVPAGGKKLVTFTTNAQGVFVLYGELLGQPDIPLRDMRLDINAGSCWQEMKERENPIAYTPESVAAGHQLFLQRCAACHGESGKGDGPKASRLSARPSDISRPELAALSDGEIFWVIRDGEGDMPSFRNILPDADKWRVVNYVRSLIQKSPSEK